MCPFCIATAAMVFAIATSTGGAGAVLLQLRAKNGIGDGTRYGTGKSIHNPNPRRNYDGDH